MSVTIEYLDIRATISDRIWTSHDETLAAVLNAIRDPAGMSASYPNIDLAIAQQAVERIGGIIVESDPPQPVDENVVY